MATSDELEVARSPTAAAAVPASAGRTRANCSAVTSVVGRLPGGHTKVSMYARQRARKSSYHPRGSPGAGAKSRTDQRLWWVGAKPADKGMAMSPDCSQVRRGSFAARTCNRLVKLPNVAVNPSPPCDGNLRW